MDGKCKNCGGDISSSPPKDILDEDELEAILMFARNGESGRITERDITLLVEAYRTINK